MSNLSDIGFPTRSEQDINDMISHCLELTETVRCPRGFYLKFADASGAQIWLQGSFDQELLGFNPHFAGKSRRRVQLTQAIERESSALDGGFYALTKLTDDSAEISGDYPFVFDAPDFRLYEISKFPLLCEIQLTAFASNDFKLYTDEKHYADRPESDSQFSAKSFAASGLMNEEGKVETTELSAVRPIAMITGKIIEFELKTNQLSGNEFYSFLVDTFGGEIDVVADPKLLQDEPKIGGVISGHFWLSGRITETSSS